MLDLPAAHYGGYYEGFANSALWPALHSRADLIRASQEDYVSYREVNAFMARALLRFQKPNSAFWIQDYHFLVLGAELRELGVTQPIGFFLHTPWPHACRDRRRAASSRTDRGDAGLRSDRFPDRGGLREFPVLCGADLGLDVRGGVVHSHHGRTRAAVFPIGIDPQQFAQLAAKAATHPDVSRLRRSLNGEKLAIGVDRLDYSKGLINRIKAFDRMWTLQPSLARSVSLLQIATPSRGAIEAYGNLQSDVAKLVTDVNGLHGEVDWTPIRYLNKGYGQAVLAGLYRTAQVGVVTPLQDGMNLVAKEYVAAQNPVDPGVLVLSRFAGAANELDTALIVNPHDIDGMARTIALRRVDAAGGAPDALGSDDGEAARRHHPAMVRRLHRCAVGRPRRPNRYLSLGRRHRRSAGRAAATPRHQRRAVSLKRFRAKWIPVRVKKTRGNLKSGAPFQFNRNGQGSVDPALGAPLQRSAKRRLKGCRPDCGLRVLAAMRGVVRRRAELFMGGALAPDPLALLTMRV